MRITSDWHIHSRNSCDGACMAIADLVGDAERKGIRDFGVSDHLHSSFNLADIVRSRKEFLAVTTSPRFHFGIEVSSMSQWELEEIAGGKHENPVYGLRSGGPPGAPLAIALSAEDIAAYQIEYVIGGTHWPMYVEKEREAVIRDYHRQNMFLATHPLVDIVAHPWWWSGHWADARGNYPAEPWFDDFGVIPESMHDEFAAAAIEHGSAVEINISANLLNPRYPAVFTPRYLEYLAGLQSRGVMLSIGSDCHSMRYEIDFEKIEHMLESAGIRDEFWSLTPRRATLRASSQ